MDANSFTLPDILISTTRKFLDGQFNIQSNTSDMKITIQDNVAFVRLKGLVSMAEKEFSKKAKGEEMIRTVYHKLFESSSLLFESMIKNSTGLEVRNISAKIEPEHLELLLVIHFKKKIK